MISHPTCEDPNCAICRERERVAALQVKAALRSPAMTRMRELVARRRKRAQA